MNLGENIYRLRTERNMSQGDLADALDVSRQSVSKWENNAATPELEKLLKMSSLFGVTLDRLVGKEAASSPAPQSASPEVPARQPMPVHQILGIVLLCFGLLTCLVLTLMGGIVVSIPIGLPFIVTGVICMVCKEHLLFKCAWSLFAIYLPMVIPFVLNMIGYRFAVTVIAALLACFAALIVWTIIGVRRGWLKKGAKKFIAICIAVLAAVTVAGIVFSAMWLPNSGLKTAGGPDAIEAEQAAIVSTE